MEINRNTYFKIKGKYLVISILRKIFTFIMVVSIVLLLAWAIMKTIFEQNNVTSNFFLDNKQVIMLVLRYIVIIPSSIFVILLIIDIIMHRYLKKQKKELAIIDEI